MHIHILWCFCTVDRALERHLTCKTYTQILKGHVEKTWLNVDNSRLVKQNPDVVIVSR